MMQTELLRTIQSFLHNNVGTGVHLKNVSSVPGGSINQCYRLQTNDGVSFFCKVNAAAAFPQMFRKERNGLQLLKDTGVIRVPNVLGVIEENDTQMLIMEWIEEGRPTEAFWKNFGEKLAALHSFVGPYFGLNEHNYMGALPQTNTPTDSWLNFFIEHRLKPQVQLAVSNRELSLKEAELFENFYPKLSNYFQETSAALLHGDLWSGNFLCDAQQQPVLLDPACYYGEPAVDLAMTTLFGGFDDVFYSSYTTHRPLPSNHRQQWELCNLYPLLIHLNLFGNSYLPAILRTIKQY